jgi:hypothetical protein
VVRFIINRFQTEPIDDRIGIFPLIDVDGRFKRRFFTKSRIFFEKRSKLSDQAFAKKCCAAILVLKVSQNLRRQTELLYGIFGYVIGQNIAKHREG